MSTCNLNSKLLYQKITQGDVKAFESFYMHYHGKLFVFAHKFIKDPDVIKDLIQDLFLCLWEKPHTIQDEAVDTYLYTAIKYRCLNHLRRSSTVQEATNVDLVTIAELKAGYYQSHQCEIMNTISMNEISTITQQVLNNLPEQRRVIYELSRNEGLSVSEIADRLNLSPRTVESHIYRVLKILKIELCDYLFLLLLVIGVSIL